MKKLTQMMIIAVCFINGWQSTAQTKDSLFLQDSVRYKFAPIVVTGQRYQMPQKDVAASISIITPAEIEQTNLATVADAVSYLTPGVFTTKRSTIGYGVAELAGGSMTIRGIGGKPNSQVLVLIDGRPDFQGIFSHPLNDAYSLDNVDHIEVLRGPASAVYGTNALGGVVNIITKQLPAKGFNTQLHVGYGTYNTQKYLFQHSGGLGKLQYYLSAGLNRSDGHRENAQFIGQSYALKLGYRLNSNFKVTFNGTMTPYEFNDPGPLGIALSGYFDKGKISRYSSDITLSNDFGTSSGSIKIHGNFGDHDLSDGWKSFDQTNGIIAFQNFNLPWDVKTTLGFDLKRYGGEAESEGRKLGTFYNDEYAVYFHLQKTLLKRFILATGVRLENNSHYGRETLPKLGLVYHAFSQTAFRISTAKGFRSPSVKDLFLFPPANADLQPERLMNYELGLNQTLGAYFSIDICGYYYEGDQLIQTSMIAPGQMQNINIGENTARGFEIALQSEPLENLQANLSYSYLDSDQLLPFSPNKFNFMVNYATAKLAMSLYGEYIHELYRSYQPATFPPKTMIERADNYTLVHLKIQYPLYTGLQLAVGIENLFDQSYEILKAYPMPGRTIMVNLRYSF